MRSVYSYIIETALGFPNISLVTAPAREGLDIVLHACRQSSTVHCIHASEVFTLASVLKEQLRTSCVSEASKNREYARTSPTTAKSQ